MMRLKRIRPGVYDLLVNGYSVANVRRSGTLWCASEHAWLAPSDRGAVYLYRATLAGIVRDWITP